MSLTINEDEIKKQLREREETKDADIAVLNNRTKDVTVRIITPSMDFSIDQDALLAQLGDEIPELSGAVASRDFAEVLKILTNNVARLIPRLRSHERAGFMRVDFKADQNEAGQKHYHCTLRHVLEAQRHPPSYFDYALGERGMLLFNGGRRALRHDQVPADSPSDTILVESEDASASSSLEVPYSSNGKFGIRWRGIADNQEFLPLVVAELLFGKQTSRVVLVSTTIRIQEVDEAEYREIRSRLALRAAPPEKREHSMRALMESYDAVLDANRELARASFAMAYEPDGGATYDVDPSPGSTVEASEREDAPAPADARETSPKREGAEQNKRETRRRARSER